MLSEFKLNDLRKIKFGLLTKSIPSIFFQKCHATRLTSRPSLWATQPEDPVPALLHLKVPKAGEFFVSGNFGTFLFESPKLVERQAAHSYLASEKERKKGGLKQAHEPDAPISYL